MNNSTLNREQRIRRALRKYNYSLWELREGPEYWEFGPYEIVDDGTDTVVKYGLELDDVDDFLAALQVLLPSGFHNLH